MQLHNVQHQHYSLTCTAGHSKSPHPQEQRGVTNPASCLRYSIEGSEAKLAPFCLLERLHLSQIQEGSEKNSEASDKHEREQVLAQEKHSECRVITRTNIQ